jgi:hypothetical protein
MKKLRVAISVSEIFGVAMGVFEVHSNSFHVASCGTVLFA